MAVGIIMVLNPLAQIQKARDASRKSDLSQIQKALETYYNDNGKYPPTGGKTSTPNYAIIGLDGNVVDWDKPWLPYMSKLPKDPSSSKNYVYNSGPDRQSYYIYASLDRETYVLNNFPSGAGCGSGSCNYGVSSPNVSP